MLTVIVGLLGSGNSSTCSPFAEDVLGDPLDRGDLHGRGGAGDSAAGFGFGAGLAAWAARLAASARAARTDRTGLGNLIALLLQSGEAALLGLDGKAGYYNRSAGRPIPIWDELNRRR